MNLPAVASAHGNSAPSHIKGFTRPQLQFLAYLRQYQPTAYAIALDRAGVVPGSTLGEIQYGPGMGATSSSGSTSIWSSITNTLSNLGQAYLGYTSQQKLMNVQLARAQQGLPPLPPNQYTVPVPIQVGLSSKTASQLGTKVAGGLSGLSTPLMLGGAAVVALLFLGKKKGR